MQSRYISMNCSFLATIAALFIGIASSGCKATIVQAGVREGAAFVVVAPTALQPALVPYVQYKQSDLPTALVSLETILLQFSGADDPEKLKRYLYQQYREQGTRYVLLVGDADVLPVRYMCLDRATKEAYNYAFYPSDLYYSDLAKEDGSFEDWNGAYEGFHGMYFGEVRGESNKNDDINYDKVDYRPDVAVGRWPARNLAEVTAMVTKNIAYESNAAKTLAREAGFITVGGWVDCRAFMDRLAEKLKSRFHTNLFYDGKTPPGEKQVGEFIQSGADLLLHAGHGHDNGWEGSIHTKTIQNLSNDGRFPIVMSAGCSTARFATLPPYEPYSDIYGKEHRGTNGGEVFTEPPPPPSPYAIGKYNFSGLGEELVRANGRGAVAYFGCNTGSQPCALTLMEGFVDSLASAAVARPRLGDLWCGAVRYYYKKERLPELQPNQDWYPPSIFFQGMKFMFFGDPTLRLPAAGNR